MTAPLPPELKLGLHAHPQTRSHRAAWAPLALAQD